MYFLFIKSRCLKAIPLSSEYLIGTNTNIESSIIKAKFSEDDRTLTTKEIIKFDSSFSDKIYNEVVDIYLNNTNIITQVYNQSANHYELFQFNENYENIKIFENDTKFE